MSAGCPLAVNIDPPEQCPLIPDVKNLTKYIGEQLSDDTLYIKLIEELGKAEKDSENIEDILSFVRGLLQVCKGGDVRGFSEKDLESIETNICDLIVNKLNVELPTKETPYHNLSKWISSLDRKIAIEVFTTNYDLLMEQAFEDIEVPYFDGFVGSKKSFFDLRALENDSMPEHWSRLWKLHGSINWYQHGGAGERKVHRSSEVKSGLSHLIYPSHLKYQESRKMPYLALIDQLNNFIRKKSSFLILVGYSFNDEHLNDTIVNALKANPTAMVLCLQFDTYCQSQEGEQDIYRYPKGYYLAERQHNLNIWTFDKAIIGTKEGRWSSGKESSDPGIIDYIIESKDEVSGSITTITKMGDFSVFSNFLQSMIGPE